MNSSKWQNVFSRLAILILVTFLFACTQSGKGNKINVSSPDAGDEKIFDGVTEVVADIGPAGGNLSIAEAKAIIPGGATTGATVSLKKVKTGYSQASQDERIAVALQIQKGKLNEAVVVSMKVDSISNPDWLKIAVYDAKGKTLKSLINATDLQVDETATGKKWISFTTEESDAIFVVIDPELIVADLSINEGAEFTKERDVQITVAASSSSYVKVNITEAESCSASDGIDEKISNLNFELSAGDGQKTLCSAFVNFWGDQASALAHIVLDTILPLSTVSTVGPKNDAFTPGPTTLITGTATDATAGIAQVTIAISSDGGTQCLNSEKTAFDSPCPVWHTPEGLESWQLSLDDSILVDGTSYSIYSLAIDKAENQQAEPSLGTIIWDLTPPVAALSDFPTDVNKIVMTDIDVLDDTGLFSYSYKIGASAGIDCNSSSGYSTVFFPEINNIKVSLMNIPDGSIKLCVIGKDEAGNVQEFSNATEALWVKDTIAPVVDAGDNVSTATQVVLDATVSDANAVTYLWSKKNGNGLLSFLHPHEEDTEVSASADGQYEVSLTAIDAAGNSATDSLYFTWDSTPPNSAFSINSDIAYTNSVSVNIYLIQSSDVVAYRKANGSDCTSAVWNDFVTHPISHDLDPVDGSRTVCLQVKDAVGNISTTSIDTIILDTTEPSSLISLGTLLSPASTPGSQTKLVGSASDAGSGIQGVGVSLQKDSSGLCLNAFKTAFDAACPQWLPAGLVIDWQLSIADAILSDGASYTLTSKAQDIAGNIQSTPDNLSFTWDSLAPSSAFKINADALYAKDATVNIDVTDVTDIAFYRINDGSDCSGAVWESFSVSPISFIMSGDDGNHVVCLQVQDAVGNTSTVTTDSISLDTMPPESVISTQGTLGINSTLGITTDFVGTATDAVSGLDKVYLSIQEGAALCLNDALSAFNAACPHWLQASGTSSWSLSVNDSVFSAGESYALKSKAVDLATNDQTYFGTASVTWDGTPADPDFVINNNGTYTNSLNVVLTLSQTTDIARYRAANGNDCSGATWSNYVGNHMNFVLGAGEGLKTVCMQVEDGVGNVSGTVTDTITLDMTQPVSVSSIVSQLSPESTPGATTILIGTASDNLSGLASVSLSVQAASGFCLNAGSTAFDTMCPVWHAATGTSSWSLSLTDSHLVNGDTYQINIQAEDLAGNSESPVVSASFTWDSAAPSASFTIAGGADSVNTTAVDLNITDTSGIAEYRKAEDSDCSAASWTVFSGNPISHALSTGDGNKQVCLQVKDGLENISSTVVETIALDTSLPSSVVSSTGTFGPNSTSGSLTAFVGTASDSTSGVATVSLSLEETGSGNCLNAGKSAFDAVCPVWHVANGLQSWTLSLNDSLFVDGLTYGLSSRAADNASNVQTSFGTSSITWDTTSPGAPFVINADATYANATAVNLTLADPTGVVQYRKANGSNCSAVGWVGYAGNPISHAITTSQGSQTVCLQVKDGVGNASLVSTDSIIFDNVAPSSMISSSGTLGPDSTVGVNTTLEGTASDVTSGVASVSISIQAGAGNCLNAGKTAFNAACPVWHAATGTTAWSFALADSLLTDSVTYNLSSRATDNASNAQVSFGTSSFVWDQTPPDPSFVINGDANYTNTTASSLTLSDTTQVVEYRKANGSDCSGASWVSFSGNPIAHTLTTSQGAQTVCMQVKDGVGNISTTATDSIIYDDVLPTSTVSTSGIIGPDSTAGINTDVTGTASDATSGVASVSVSIQEGAGNCLNVGKTAFDAACPVWHSASGATSWTLTVADSIFADSTTYNVSAKATDNATNVQVSLGTGSFIWDLGPPDPTFVINANASYTTSTSVNLTLSDPTDVAQYRKANGSDCSGASWVAYTVNPIAHTLTASQGSQTVCLQVKDGVGNTSSTATDTITLDDVKPASIVTTSGILGIDSTAGANTTLSGTASDATSGVASMSISIQAGAGNCLNAGKTAFDTACPVWHTATGTTSWTLSLADSLFSDTVTYNISSRGTDTAGNVQTSFGTGSFTWDGLPPDPSFNIDAGASYTTSTSVNLNLSDTTGISQYRKANGADCSGASWVAYTVNPIAHTLTASQGSQTVCAQVKDSVGNVSGTATDTIIYDNVKPASVVTTSGTLGIDSTVGANTDLTGTASDATSGVASVSISLQAGAGNCLNAGKTAFNAACPVWHAATGTTSWTLSLADTLFSDSVTYNISARGTDAAGNVQTSFSTGSFTWDGTPPDPTFNINAGATYSTNTSVNLNLSNTTGISQYRKANGADCSGASWVGYTVNPIAHTLTASQGSQTVCLQVKDAVGNISTTATDTIIYDNVKPASVVTTSGTLGIDSTAGANTTLSGTASDATSGVASVSISIQAGAGNCLNAGKIAFDTACPVWHAATGTTSWTLSLADTLFSDAVTYNISARGTDAAGNVQTSFGAGSFTWDGTPPDPTFNINAGATYSTSTSVNLNLSDTTGISQYRKANGADCSGASWVGYTVNPIAHTLTASQGSQTVCLQVKDSVGNISTTATDTIIYDNVKPASVVTTSGTLGIDSTAGANTDITGTSSDATSGVSSMSISLQAGAGNCLNVGKTAFDTACPVWHAATGTTSWTLSLADTLFSDAVTYNISARGTDAAGNVQTSFGTGSFTWDGSAPDPSFNINAGATYSTSTSVNLNLSNTTGISQYRKTNGADCSGASWVGYTVNPIAHTLTASQGSQTVCVQVKDSVGNISTTATDTIIYDNVKPASVVSTSGTLGIDSTAGANTNITGTASDATSGVASMSVSLQAGAGNCLNAGKTAFNAACPVWHAATGTTSWTLSLADTLFGDSVTYNISARGTDAAGNVQTSFGTGSFTWDGVPPDPTFNINAGATYSTSTSVNLNLSNTAGISQYRKANGADCSGASWTAYTVNPIAHTLTASQGSQTVCIQVKDAVGNISTTATDTIIYDNVLPSSGVTIANYLGPNSTAGATTSFSGTASDATSGVQNVAIYIQLGAGNCLNAGATAFDTACPVWHNASGTTAWNISFNDSIFTSGQTYNMKTRAQDNAGNYQTSFGTDSFIWDSVAPSGSLTTSEWYDTTTAGANSDFSGPYADALSGVVSVEISVKDSAGLCLNAGKTAFDAVCPVSLSTTLAANWTLSLADSLFKTGTYQVKVRATDDAGNTSNWSNGNVHWREVPKARFIQITAGRYHTCGVTSNHDAYCWGQNVSGVLGVNTTTEVALNAYAYRPQYKVNGGHKWIKISTSEQVTCGLSVDGKVYCWGLNSYGLIGNPDYPPLDTIQPTPYQIGIGQGSSEYYKDLVVGANYACALQEDGEVMCWGRGDSGQMGNGGTNLNNISPRLVNYVGGSDKYITLFGGYTSPCAVTAFNDATYGTGHLYCWGGDWNGSLGNGSPKAASSVPVSVTLNKKFIDFDGLDSSNCAIASDGSLYCWGRDNFGQIGDGNDGQAEHLSPQITSTAEKFIAVGGGDVHACALNDSGKPYCWGANGSGNAGQPLASTMVYLPTAVSGVAAEHHYIAITGGNSHNCALRDTGEVACWGANTYGQLGDNNGANPNTYTPVDVDVSLISADQGWKQVVAGDQHVCGLNAAGYAYCWGRGDNGALGYTDKVTPVDQNLAELVSINHISSETIHFKKISAGSNHTCGLTGGGDIYCWGQNAFGQLGDGSNTTRNVAVKINSSLKFRDVNLGSNTSCGLTSDGEGYCWGEGTSGQLGEGVGVFNNRSSPTHISASGNKFFKIVPGNDATCSMLDSRQAICWGDDSSEPRLGDGASVSSVQVPTALVTGGYVFRDIFMEGDTACGIESSQTGLCWGNNSLGQMGVGNQIDYGYPQSFAGANLQNISTSVNHTCASSVLGELYCFGQRANYKIGDGSAAGNALTPYKFTTDSLEVTVGLQFTCYRNTSGLIKCLGDHTYKQMGSGGASGNYSTFQSLDLTDVLWY